MDATDALKDNNQHTKDVNAEGYTNKVVSASGDLPNGELNNYKVTVGDTAKVHLTPAEVHLKLKDVSTTYGTAFDIDDYGYDASKLVMANGDNASVVTGAITNKDITYTNTGDGTNGKATDHAGTYKLSGKTGRIVKLSATPLRNRLHMVFCSQGTSWGAGSTHGTSVGCNPLAYP